MQAYTIRSTDAVARYLAACSTSEFILSTMSVVVASSIHILWEWSVTSLGAAILKSGSTVVLVEGTMRPMRFRIAISTPPVDVDSLGRGGPAAAG